MSTVCLLSDRHVLDEYLVYRVRVVFGRRRTLTLQLMSNEYQIYFCHTHLSIAQLSLNDIYRNRVHIEALSIQTHLKSGYFIEELSGKITIELSSNCAWWMTPMWNSERCHTSISPREQILPHSTNSVSENIVLQDEQSFMMLIIWFTGLSHFNNHYASKELFRMFLSTTTNSR